MVASMLVTAATIESKCLLAVDLTIKYYVIVFHEHFMSISHTVEIPGSESGRVRLNRLQKA